MISLRANSICSLMNRIPLSIPDPRMLPRPAPVRTFGTGSLQSPLGRPRNGYLSAYSVLCILTGLWNTDCSLFFCRIPGLHVSQYNIRGTKYNLRTSTRRRPPCPAIQSFRGKVWVHALVIWTRSPRNIYYTGPTGQFLAESGIGVY